MFIVILVLLSYFDHSKRMHFNESYVMFTDSGYPVIQYVMSIRGSPQLDIDGWRFTRKQMTKNTIQWICVQTKALKCKARAITNSKGMVLQLNNSHNHPSQMQRRKPGELRKLQREMEERTMALQSDLQLVD